MFPFHYRWARKLENNKKKKDAILKSHRCWTYNASGTKQRNFSSLDCDFFFFSAIYVVLDETRVVVDSPPGLSPAQYLVPRCHSYFDIHPFRHPPARYPRIFGTPVPYILRIYGIPNGTPWEILHPPSRVAPIEVNCTKIYTKYRWNIRSPLASQWTVLMFDTIWKSTSKLGKIFDSLWLGLLAAGSSLHVKLMGIVARIQVQRHSS
jgi:hypothetical protein